MTATGYQRVEPIATLPELHAWAVAHGVEVEELGRDLEGLTVYAARDGDRTRVCKARKCTCPPARCYCPGSSGRAMNVPTRGTTSSTPSATSSLTVRRTVERARPYS